MAALLDSKRDAICAQASGLIKSRFPALCYDPTRPDAIEFQQSMFHGTPQRIHDLMQVVLQLHTLGSINDEYSWSWGLLPRYGVTGDHLLAFMRMYFDIVKHEVAMAPEDLDGLNLLEKTVIDRITAIITKQR